MTISSTTSRTLPAVECAPWCSSGDGHPDEWHPRDQACLSDKPTVQLALMPLLEGGPDDMGAYLLRERAAGSTTVELTHNDLPVASLTLDEAAAYAQAIVQLVQAAR